MLAVLILAATASAGCVSLPENGALKCGPNPAHPCPSGFHCALDGTCWRGEQNPDGGSVTIVTPPAAVWISSGGGSSSAASGTRLNTCVGGAIAPGTQLAPSGARISHGYFTSGTH